MFRGRQKSTPTPATAAAAPAATVRLVSPPPLRSAAGDAGERKSAARDDTSSSGGSGGGGGGGGGGGTSSKAPAGKKTEAGLPAASQAFLAEKPHASLSPLSPLFSHSGQTDQYAFKKTLYKTRLSVLVNAVGADVYEQCEADLLHFAVLSAYRDNLLEQAQLLASGCIKQEAHLITQEWRNTLSGYYAGYPTVPFEEDDRGTATTLSITGNQFLNALTLLAAVPRAHLNQKTVTAILRFAYRPLLPDALYQAHASQLELLADAGSAEVEGSPQDIRNALLKELTDLGFTKNNEGNTFDSQQLILWQKETLFLMEVARHLIVEKLLENPEAFSESDFVRQLEALKTLLQDRRPRIINSRPGRSITRASSGSDASRSLRTRSSSRHLAFEDDEMTALQADIQSIKAIISNEPAPKASGVSESVAIDVAADKDEPDAGPHTPLRPSGAYATASTTSYGPLLPASAARPNVSGLFSDYPPHALAMFYRKFIDETPGLTAQFEYIRTAISNGTASILLEFSTHPDIITKLLGALLRELWQDVLRDFEALPEHACLDLPLINLLSRLAFHPLFPDAPTKNAQLYQAVNKAITCLRQEEFCAELVRVLAHICDGVGTGPIRFSDLRQALFFALLMNTPPANPVQRQRWELLHSAAPALISAWSQRFLHRLKGNDEDPDQDPSAVPALLTQEGWLPLIADFDTDTHQFSLHDHGFNASPLLLQAIPPVHQDVYRVLSRFFLLNAHTGRMPTTVAAQQHLLQMLQTTATRFFPAKQGSESAIQDLLAVALPSALSEANKYKLAQALWIAHINYILATPTAMTTLRSFAAAELRSVARQSGAAETKRAFIFEEHAQRELLEIHLTILKASIQRKKTIGLKLLSAALALIPTLLFGVSTYEFVRHNDPKFTVVPQETAHAGNLNLILAGSCGSLVTAIARSLWHFTTPKPKRLLAELADFDASSWNKLYRHWGAEAALFAAVHSLNLYMLYLDSQDKIYDDIKDNSFFKTWGHPGLIIFILNMLLHLTLAPWLMRVGERAYYEWAPQATTDAEDGPKEINLDREADGKEADGVALQLLVSASTPCVTRTRSIFLGTPADMLAQTEVATSLSQETSGRSRSLTISDSRIFPPAASTTDAHDEAQLAADSNGAAPSKIGSWTDVRTISNSQRGVSLTGSPMRGGGGRRVNPSH